MPKRRFAILFTSVFLSAMCAAAADYDSSLFAHLKWRNIGPNRGGRSLTSSGSSQRPNEYYFGAVGGGVWKTTDSGISWKPVTDGQIKSSSVGALAVSASNPDIVYIGMGETELRGNIMQGDGVYRTSDAGKTWKHIGLQDTQSISRIRIHPTNPDIVYVAALGHPYGASDDRGIFRTTDGGQTWKRILFRNNKAGAVDLCMDPQNPKVLFAAIWDVYRTPWSLSSGGPASGLFKTTDGGDTWTEITRNPGLPANIIGKIGVSVSGADSNRIYAIVEAEDGGVYRSDDAGANWTKVSEDRKLRQRAFYYSRIYSDPKAKDTLYICNVGFFKSTDGGKTYTTIRPPHGDNHDLWIDPANPQRMVQSNDGGANVSNNGGATWTGQNYPTAQLYHVSTTRDVPYHVCGAQQDNTTLCVPSDTGVNFRDPRATPGSWLYAVGGGESGYIAPHPTEPDLFYAGSQGALLTEYNRRTAQVRDIQVYPLFFSGMPARDLKERWQWTFPIVFSPQDPNVLYTSSQHLWRTTNAGQSWDRISPDLTRADPDTLGDSGGPITKDQNGPEIYGTIFAIAPSRFDAQTIWTGSDDGLVFVTRDGGKQWANVTPPSLPKFARISIVEASPHEPGAAFLAAKLYQLDDRRPYIFRTLDYGKTWTKITEGIPSGDFVHAVREDPKRAGLLYAGTEHGIYASFDNGGHWQSISLGLPDTQVSDLVVEENDLVIATHGRSFYLLEDLAAIRQAGPEVLSSAAYLYTPREAIRSVNKVVVDYELKTAADTVTIDILDASGTVVRSFKGTPEDDKKKPAPQAGALPAAPPNSPPAEDDEEGFGPPRQKPPTRTVGGNRFTWDLRYPGAKVFEGMILWGARADSGPLAPPGNYAVRLTANGVTMTRPFKIRIDPRLRNVTEADLQKQFTFVSDVRDKVSAADKMVIRIRELRKQSKDRMEKAKDPAIASLTDTLLTRLTQIEENLYQTKNRSNQDPLNFPIKLNNQLAALGRSAGTGDARPTDQSYVVYEELSKHLAVEQAKFDAALAGALADLNRLLEQKKLAPIPANAGAQ